MNKNFLIPPSPNWFQSHILACAPDNTLIYGSKSDVVIFHPSPEDESQQVEILTDEGSNQRVVCVDITPKWDFPNKWVLCSWEDNLIKIWDIKKRQWKKCSPSHKGDRDNLVGARFLTEDRILSVTESGAIALCHIPQLKFSHLPNVLQSKVNVACFAPCPHSSSLVALGLKNGLIVVVDLRKNGSILHRLRGHTSEVISLSWCPAPVNIFPLKPGNLIRTNSEDLDAKDDNKIETNTVCIIEGEKGDELKEDGTSLVDSKPNLEVCMALSDKSEMEGLDKDHQVSNSLIEKIEDLIIKDELKNSEQKQINESQEAVVSVIEESQEKSIVTSCKEDRECSEKVEPIVEESDSCGVEVVTEDSKKEEILPVSSKDQEEKSSENIESIEEDPPLATTSNEDVKSCETVEPIVKEKQEELLATSEETPQTMPPKSAQPLVEEPKKEFLLASCAKDSYVNIWRAKSDGRLQCFFKIVDKKVHAPKNRKPTSSVWFAIKWITPFSLLVGTRKGEVLKYTLPKPLDGRKEYTMLHNEHNNFIFTIAAHVPILTEKDWFVENVIKIWTFSHDMYLLNTILDSKITHLATIETFCALVNCMALSPVDPSRIALGLSNGTIKVWNANSSSPKSFSTVNYSPKIFGKITCLDWHPTNELIIAFSTEEGTIGLLNTNVKQKATWFQQYFSSTIHRIQWAPYADKTWLYAIGKGSLVCFDPEDPKKEPIKIDLKSDAVPYYFSWKLDMSMMLLSNSCGKISVYDSKLAHMASYYNNKKISLMLWHPDSVCETTTPRSFWVASAMDNILYLFDFAEVTEKQGTLNIEDVVKTKMTIHCGSIKSLAWSHFVANQLVTAGEDGLAYVLDIATETILASYYDARFNSIKAIVWSPIEEDLLIMTLSRCAMLMGWKTEDHKGALSEDVLKECENHVKNSKKSNVSTQKEEEAAKKMKKVIKTAKSVILPAVNIGTIEPGEEKVKILREILEETEENFSKEKSSFGKLFGTKDEVMTLLNTSEQSHISKGKFEAATTVSVFKGDLKDHIVEAIEQYRVTPLLISLAPMVSISLWQKACQTYAGQLAGKPDADPLEVALHFLACNNIEQAIEYLCEKELYKEALSLAKTRLPHDSIIIENIVMRWAQFSTICGNLETGAICYIKLGKYEEAVKLLFRRNELNILSLALELAEKTGNTELIKAVQFRYNAFLKNDSDQIQKSDELIEKEIDTVEAEEKEDGIASGTKLPEQSAMDCSNPEVSSPQCGLEEVSQNAELHVTESEESIIETDNVD
ncbi:gem-associated protein 5 [Coccinella septempunctata]|uniref:gem-associated protein 5 n=1 Tax=Coccinella septempunctata TaxID=41139 RepID=UPI001D06C750|nr:gem-associated protein 5 [Coccinella septempunctata]